MLAARAPRFRRAAPVLVCALAAAFAIHRLEDFDVWYHLAAGRLMATSWRWPTTNTFAFTAPDYSWIDLHWIFQLALYAAYRLAGVDGCILLAATLLVATVLVLYALSRRWVAPVVAALLLATALTVASPRFVPRPELVSFLLFAIYLTLLEGHPANRRLLYLLVPLQIVWVNTQGIFAIGLALIGCYWAGTTLAFLPLPRGWREATRCTPSDWRRATVVLALAVAGCVLNPYGTAGALFPLELLPRVTGNSLFSSRIGEFRGPLQSGFAPVLAYVWIGLMVATAVAFAANLRRWHLGRVLAAVAFGWLSTQALRNMAFFAWIAVPAIAANLGELAARRLPDRRARRDGAKTAASGPAYRVAVVRGLEGAGLTAIAVLIAAVVTNHFSHLLATEREFGLGVSRARFSEEAIAFLEESGIEGRPFNCLAMGGYLAWTRYPSPVFVDGRLEAFPESLFRSYFKVMDSPETWPEVMRPYPVDYVLLFHLWPNRLPLIGYLAGGAGWRLVYYDEIVSIFLPTDEAHRAVRERAERVFADRLARRAASPPSTPGSVARLLAVPVAETWRQRAYGNLLRTLGRHDEAAEAYRRALALDPDLAEVRFTLGLSLWYAGKHEAAIVEWRDLLRRDPTNQSARRALAEATRQ